MEVFKNEKEIEDFYKHLNTPSKDNIPSKDIVLSMKTVSQKQCRVLNQNKSGKAFEWS